MGVFLDLGQEDFQKVSWTANTVDNLSSDELHALKELQDAERLVIKPSDKGGNVVLLSTNKYEKKVRLDSNAFPQLVGLINDELQWAFEVDLLSKKELNYLKVGELNIPRFYIIPKIHKNQEDPPGPSIVSN